MLGKIICIKLSSNKKCDNYSALPITQLESRICHHEAITAYINAIPCTQLLYLVRVANSVSNTYYLLDYLLYTITDWIEGRT